MIKKKIGEFMYKIAGWSYDLQCDLPPKAVYVTGQHTSLLEGYLVIAFALQNPHFTPYMLIAKEYFRWPLGPVLRYVGGVPVNRGNPGNIVSKMIEELDKHSPSGIGVCPEGTRKKVAGWKKGFYHIASKLGCPIIFGAFDPKTKVFTISKQIEDASKLTFDETLDVAREFYSTRTGIHPEKASPIRYYKAKDEHNKD